MAKKKADLEIQDVINVEDGVFKKLVMTIIKSKNDAVELEKDDDISLSKKEKDIAVDLKLNLIYGKNILSTIHEIQREIKNSIEEYTSYHTSSINVEVKNVINPKKEEVAKSVDKKKTKRSSN